jgi:hypothetical protein
MPAALSAASYDIALDIGWGFDQVRFGHFGAFAD